jgi:uncharacterized protein with HEPN domain
MAVRSRAALDDMLAAIDAIADHLRSNFGAPSRTQLRAVERELEIISEASRRIDESLKAARPDIPWRKIADLGNVIRHSYQSVDWAILSRIVAVDLPNLRQCIVAFIEGDSSES